MTRSKSIMMLVLAVAVMFCAPVRAESKREYQQRFQMMLDYAVRSNEYIRRHLGDRGLCAYAAEMAAKNADAAEQMTPPPLYADLHPHFLLVLENIERAFYYASKGKQDRYRHHQKIVRKELRILEAMAEKERLQLYLWDRDW